MERVVYFNGTLVPEGDARISLHDRGFMFADAAFDVARTFHHRPFRLERHVARLHRSLRYLHIDPGLSQEEMRRIALEVLAANGRLLNYRKGLHLMTPSVRRTPPECIDPQAKTHERLNFVVGHLEIAHADPHALPLLLDLDGNITEAFTANVFVASNGGICTPLARNCLAGVTREAVLELAHDLRMPVQEKNLTLYDVYNAAEVFLTATSFGVMPVSRVNGRSFGGEIPGAATRALLEAFCSLVDLDIVQQALRHAAHKEAAGGATS